MTRLEKIAAIRKACVAANPERWSGFRPCVNGGSECKKCGGEVMPVCPFLNADEDITIRLADVLLAMESDDQYYAIVDSLLIEEDASKPLWNLRRDSLHDQEDATVDFLYSLIEKTL